MSKLYWVESTVRSVHTRLARAQSPERPRFRQQILGGSLRLVRNRPAPISESQLKQFREELETKWRSGFIRVHEGSPDGPLYSFEKPVEKRKKRPSPPPPPPAAQKVKVEKPKGLEGFDRESEPREKTKSRKEK